MTTQEQFLARFLEITTLMFETTKAKNADYASQNDAFRNFRDFGALGILVRMGDKFARLKTALVEKREFKVNERIHDTILDLAVYAVILMIFLEREKA